MCSQYTPKARAAVSLAFTVTQIAFEGNARNRRAVRALEAAAEVMSTLLHQRDLRDLAELCQAAHRRAAVVQEFYAVREDRLQCKRWRAATHAWALALELMGESNFAG